MPATREKHLIRSLSRNALLLPAPVIPRSTNLIHPAPITSCAPSPVPRAPFPSLTKRHSHFPSGISLKNHSPSDPLQIQIYFLQRVSPPNPHLLLLDGPFPSSIFMRSLFPANGPDSRANNAFFGTLLLLSALSPCHVSPTPPPTCPPTHHMLCYLAAAAAKSNLLHHQHPAHVTMSFPSTTHTHPFPLF